MLFVNTNLYKYLKYSSIVITGGLGYIGSNLLVELQKRVHISTNIIVIDNFSNCKQHTINKIDYITGNNTKKSFARIQYFEADLCNISQIDKIFKETHSTINPIRLVIHLGALKSVGESVKNPLKYYQNNIDSTFVILNLMEKYNIKHLLFASSASVYGNPVHETIDENHPLNPISPYGKSKMMCEQIIKDVCEKSNTNTNIKSIALRYFNPVGSSPGDLLGEDCKGTPSNLMPFIAKVATGELERVHVYGDTHNTHDGTGVRDYIHIHDLIEAHFSALNHLLESDTKDTSDTRFDVFNIGSGIGYSVLDMLNCTQSISNKKIPYTITEPRPGDPSKIISNIEKAKQILKWEPKYGIQAMCKSAYTSEVILSKIKI